MLRAGLVVVAAAALSLVVVAQQKKGPPPPLVKPTAEETRQIQAKIDEIDGAVRTLKSRRADPDLVADVEIYANAGRLLLEFPEDFFTQDGINHTLTVLDTGIERAHSLEKGQSPWTQQRPKRTHGYYSALDGSVQPYGVTLPASYDGSHPVRLYVWMHGRAARMNEADFLYNFPNQGPGRPPVADNGQIQLDLYGRWNSAGYHFAGEADVFEAVAAVEKRYKIDPKRVLLRGFSMGGEGAWHIALHYPDRWAAAEIGAGTWSRRAEATPDLTSYQRATLRIWENYTEWALNFFNLPLAGHDGETDTQVASLPPPAPGVPTRGQLESSIKVREQLEKEGFPSEGDPYNYRAKGTPAIFLISKNTGHGTSPEVRQQLDTFLKEYGDRGQESPDHIRFLTYTTRYNRDYWVSLEALEKHYERAEVDAQRFEGGRRYQIATKNLTRLTLRETGRAAEIRIDGATLKVKAGPEIVLEKSTGGWHVASTAKVAGLHKVHGLQGPFDDAFLDPFLLVRPTGTPWNEAVHQQLLRSMQRFDRLYAKYFRAHPRIVNDKDLTEADVARYNVVLFGDPGSNPWIAKVMGKLPVQWTRDAVTLGGQKFPASDSFPALVYPNPLDPSHYVVINSGLTISDREYIGDYGMPRLGDFAVLKVKEGADIPDVATAGLFDEAWQLPPEPSKGLFESSGDLGVTPRTGAFEYDAASGEYHVTGGGANIWAAEDAGHFAWKRLTGDVTLTADIRFLGVGAVAHRKAVLMVRQDLTPGSAYADVALHGDGMSSLQFRPTAGAQTQESRSTVNGAVHLRLERRGNQFTMFVGKAGEEMTSTGPQAVELNGPVYVGIGVCSHDANVLETAVFSNVRVQQPQPQQRYRSKITIYDVAARTTSTLYQADQVIEAPNWSRDGKFLLVNTGGSLYRLPVTGEPKLEKIDLGSDTYRVNNDHDFTRDGTMLAFSASSPTSRGSQVYLAHADGSDVKLMVPEVPSYFHGWSPDGKWMAFVAQRAGKFQLYRIAATGGPQQRLTEKGYDDGPDYSPDGKWIYFNTNRSGGWDIWRMPAEGAGVDDAKAERVTSDEWEDWFPHPSPNGKWLLVFSFPKGTENHNGKLEGVSLRLMPLPGKRAGTAKLDQLAKFFGGQGTINVNSWSPDSRRFAYVVYEPIP